MRLPFFLTSVIFIGTFQFAFSQQITEEGAIKKVVRYEPESYMKRDSIAWKEQFVQNEKTTRAYSSFTFSDSQVGWQNFGPMMLQWMKDSTSSSPNINIGHSNHIINISDDLAFVAFDQALSIPGVDSIPPTLSRKFRTLIKDNDQWKISSIITINTQTNISTSPEVMEGYFNFLGYSYLEDNMIDKALEVFKLNVKLYPTAWNTYDSLGEAYALAGNKDLAVENYKKSIELNPENEHVKDMLGRIEGK